VVAQIPHFLIEGSESWSSLVLADCEDNFRLS
jgi:hypothetical protein